MITLPPMLDRAAAIGLDFAMCRAMNLLQRRHRLAAGSLDALERYIAGTLLLSRGEYYAPSEAGGPTFQHDSHIAAWDSGIASGFPKNDRATAVWFPAANGRPAPTVLMLHALMSASDA
jgi:hypothetical protein